MPSAEIPEVKFRLQYGFTVRPDLEIDAGPGGGIVM